MKWVLIGIGAVLVVLIIAVIMICAAASREYGIDDEDEREGET